MGKWVEPKVRFMQMVNVNSVTGCWEWTGSLNRQGYGYFRLSAERRGGAHRMGWLLFRGGELADYTQIDHQCHNQDPNCPGGPTCRHRRCVNPDHLLPASPWQNSNGAIWRATPPPSYHKLVAREIAEMLEREAGRARLKSQRGGYTAAAELIRAKYDVYARSADEPAVRVYSPPHGADCLP